ncbi:MAG: hypothetical protein UT48_C0036G0005 [Parcubacteria group bacterium GW2011_GWE2_39_37]|uniref:Uncharacterized protein n=1 Tax=Candidatus Falkowbacteria bacterium GW2011_GWF2_39_8 TaxID=1618642 RepID=A0A0G0PZG3_9BACT|nr:MAG: hypothetical protein UT48_C0036G0005 [Parcubacteria group bacterium GW2011_GWE2_39_37]KKR33278.1 MAG: hypothetical protein UT64_C0011G0011 [Candidatus Falkowbacteria bacterium GW2011_GWF2_39_8]
MYNIIAKKIILEGGEEFGVDIEGVKGASVVFFWQYRFMAIGENEGPARRFCCCFLARKDYASSLNERLATGEMISRACRLSQGKRL